MAEKYCHTVTSRATKTGGGNPKAPDQNTTKAEVAQKSTENRTHHSDGRLKG
jgi:hypothetical protein